MASVKVYFDKRHKRKDKTYALKLNVTFKGSFLINLKIYLFKNQWDGKKVVNHPQRNFLNIIINQRVTQAEGLMLRLAASGDLKNMTRQELKTIIEANSVEPESEEDSNEDYLFITHYEKFLAEKIKRSTREKYTGTHTRIKEYADINTLTFSQINLAWLNGFERHLMKTTPSINGRGVHFRNIRAIFNDAINHDLVPLSLYPFRRFKIKKQITPKRSLTPEQIILIRDTDWGKRHQVAADAFMLIFYLIGINVVDLLKLKEITLDGRVEYNREKTGRLYSIKVPPQAIEIIEKYKGNERLLLWGEHYKEHRSFLKLINKRFDDIGKQIKAPALTSYYARHSWATIAASIDIPRDTISAALGHGMNTVTDIYIDFDRNKIDEANEKVIQHLHSLSTKEKGE